MSKVEASTPRLEPIDIMVLPSTVDPSGIQIPSSAPTPWGLRHLAAVAGCNTVAFLLIALGWLQASASAVVNRQIPWLNVAIGGLALAAIGNMLWIRRQRRALVRFADQGEELWDWIARSAVPGSGPAPDPAEVRLDVEELAGSLVSGARMRLFHRSDCPFVAGKAVTGHSRPAHEAAGRTACAVCEP